MRSDGLLTRVARPMIRCSNLFTKTLATSKVLMVSAFFAAGCGGPIVDIPPHIPPAPEKPARLSSVYLFREVVRLQIGEGRVEGEGFYYFRNADRVARAFPAALTFYTAPWQQPPESLRFIHVSPDADEEVPFVWLEKNCPLAQLVVPPSRSYCLRVDWEQRLSANRFVYLLKRKPPWNLRREQIRLTVLVPRRFKNVSLNYRYTYRFDTEGHYCYVIVRNNFEPKEDLVVGWEK